MNCLSCASLDLKTHPQHARVGLGTCLTMKLPGIFRSFTREHECKRFTPAAKETIDARMKWDEKCKKTKN